MKVGFVARWSPLDKKSWSGTGYYAYSQITKQFETEIFNYKWSWTLREWLTMQKSLNRKFFKKNTSVEFLSSYAKHFSKKLQRDLKKRPVDLLFVMGSSQLIAYLKTDIPVIYMTDATFQQLQSYYPSFSNLPAYNIRQGIELDKKAFQRASHCMLTSEWSRNSAVNDYGIDPDKISVVAFGANMESIPSKNELQTEPTEKCRLLFLGVEWERKGGDIALEAFRMLRQKGINAQLKIIGCIPPHDLSVDKNITVIPYLDKNNNEDVRQLEKIFMETDFLLLPTRAECAGVVFSEASAWGIPSITTDTGGVTTYVKDRINGYALPMQAKGNSYADLICKLYDDKAGLKKLKQTSRVYFDQHLSWEHWGEQFRQIAGKLINKN
jgi:glycosyltransferase involved in cell wall biosynthesis